MKSIVRNLFMGLLAFFSRAVLRKYRPTVIMVTGSVGKTSTKDAIAAALSHARYLRAPEKSYNSEFGVPFTILGAKNPWNNPFAWLKVFGEGVLLLLLPNFYPKLLVLEVGADRPGDLARILRFVTPDVVVLTRLPEMPVHVEAYATPDAVREEEFQPAYALSPNAPLIISADDSYARELARPLERELITFGFAEDATVRVGSPELLIEDGRPVGMSTTVTVEGKTHPLLVRGALGSPQVLAPAAALAAALAIGVEPADALTGLEKYDPPPGRGRILRGKQDSVLIDDTYNASPASVDEALATLALVNRSTPGTRTVAVLGDMLELGRYSHEAHVRIGIVAAKRVDVLVTVGSRARAIAEAAKGAGMRDEQVFSYDTSAEAAPEMLRLLQANDTVLIKGSQSIRTERIVEVLLENPDDSKLLVRQDGGWRGK